MQAFFIKLAYFSIGFAVQALYLHLMDSLLVPKIKNRLVRLAPAALMALLAVVVCAQLPPLARLMINTAYYLAVPLVLYRGKIAAKFLAFALWMVTYPCSESIALLIAPLWGWQYEGAGTINQLLFDFTCLLVTCVFYIAIKSIKHVIDERPGTRILLRLCCTALAMVACTFIILVNSVHLAGLVVHPVLLRALSYLNALGVFMPFFALHSLFALLTRLSASLQEAEQYRAMEARAKRELRQTHALAAKDERYRQLRHDFRNHLLAMDALAQRGETDRLREYIASLCETVESSGQNVYCGNPLIDGLLDSKALRMQEDGIDVHWRMHPAPEKLPVSDMIVIATVLFDTDDVQTVLTQALQIIVDTLTFC